MPVVETSQGRVRGERRGGISVFRRIPYAKPPLGELRFAAPLPADSWPGELEATRFSPVAPQLGTEAGAIGRLFRVVRGGVSEDCLYVNVWTPGCDGAHRPVMVYIHGGAFLLGAGSTFVYEGSALARLGAVVVTFNYRLGAFGFLDLTQLVSESSPPANAGLKDQLAALKWVRTNISAFGGDPGNVTLFGESAGAMSAAVHLGLEPSATRRRAFRRAILQSGAAANVSSRDQSAYIGDRFLSAASVRPREWRRLFDLPMEALLAAQRSALGGDRSRMGRLPWQPSLDGDLIRTAPLESVRRGSARDVDLLIGTTRDEWKLFGLGELKLRRMGAEELERRVASALRRSGGDPGSAGELIRRHLSDRRRNRAYEAWVSLRTEQVFGLPATQLAQAHARHRPECYAFRFDQPAPRMPKALGACHGIDLGFVFGTFAHPLLWPVYGRSKAVAELSRAVRECWVSFATSGRPWLRRGPAWERYESGRRSTMSLSTKPFLFNGPDASSQRFWPR